MIPQSRIVMRRRGAPPAATPSRPIRWRRWFVAYGALMLAGAAIYVVRLPQWRVDRVAVTGTVKLDAAALGAVALEAISGSYAPFIPRNSYVLARTSAATERLTAAFPRIAALDVVKEFPDTLHVTVREREFWGVYCALARTVPEPNIPDAVVPGGGDANADVGATEDTISQFPPDYSPDTCVLIDETGFAYEEAPTSTGAVLRKIYNDRTAAVVGVPALSLTEMDFLRRAAEGAEEATESVVTDLYVLIDYPGEIRVMVSDGFAIYLNNNADLTATFNILRTVLDEDIKGEQRRLEYIDLRFGNKVFYKYKD